jgi:hypothetical protein
VRILRFEQFKAFLLRLTAFEFLSFFLRLQFCQ